MTVVTPSIVREVSAMAAAVGERTQHAVLVLLRHRPVERHHDRAGEVAQILRAALDLALAGQETQHIARRFRQHAPHGARHLRGNGRHAFHQQVTRLHRVHPRLRGVHVGIAEVVGDLLRG